MRLFCPPLSGFVCRSVIALIALLILLPARMDAQTAPAQGAGAAAVVPSVRAVRATTPIVLDGRLDEAPWRDAPAAANFHQRDPNEGQPATERTEVRFVYDDTALYIGVRMFDSEPDRIVRRLSRRDDSDPDADRVILYFDPHHDHLTGAGFEVTAAGSLIDGVIYNDTEIDTSWDGVWDAKVTIDDRGWTAEIRIPFSQLRFVSGDVQTWGLNVERDIRRKNESDWWQLVPKKENGLASRMGHLENLDGIAPRRHLDLLPYTSGRAEFVRADAGNPFNDGSRAFGGLGLDLKWGVTSNLTLDGTVNPDFGQVEVDPAVVNLTAFETFYEEKRPFFLEGANIFGNFGRSGSNSYDGFNRADPSLFYSRRIGRSPQGTADGDFVDAPSATTILGAAKLTGKTAAGWSMGILEAVTGREYAQVDTGGVRSDAEIEPLTNYVVGRAKRDLGSRASIGLLATSVERDLRTQSLGDLLANRAYAFGTDGHLFLDAKRDWVVNGLMAGSYVQGSPAAITRLQTSSARYFQRLDAPHVALDPNATSMSGWDGQLNLNKNSGNVRVNAALWGVSPGFESNDAGFMMWSDRAGAHALVSWTKPNPDRWTRDRSLLVAKWWSWNFNREMQSDGFWAMAGATLRNYWGVHATANYSRSTFDDRLTRGGPSMRTPAGLSTDISADSDSRKPIGFELEGSYSRNDAGGFGSQVALSVNVKPTSSITFSTGPQISRTHAIAQYVSTVADPLAAATFGSRYVFSDLDQYEISMTTRLNFIFTPKMSLQVYAQPLLSTGHYWGFKALAAPRTFDFQRFGTGASTLAYDAAGRTYTADPDGPGPAAPFVFANPDFNFKSLRVNAIFRWEWRLGSALYIVWTEQREDLANPGDFSARRDISSMIHAHGDNVFAVKLAYWLTR